MARNHDEVHSYPVASDNSGFDTHGYVFYVDGNGRLAKATAGSETPYAVNYVSSEDEDGTVASVADDDEHDFIRESAAYPLVADAENYTRGDAIYLAGADGRVNSSSTGNTQVGVAVESNDLSGGSNGDEHLLVAFTFHG